MLTDFDLSKTSATPVTVRIKKGGPQSAPTVVAEPDLVTNRCVTSFQNCPKRYLF
jgi:hypothetical protein